jgi:hypothetical protein
MRTLDLLATTLVRTGHVRSFRVHPVHLAGWEVSEREDRHVVQHKYTDWHRVERTLAHFRRKIAALREQGWSELPDGARAAEGGL